MGPSIAGKQEHSVQSASEKAGARLDVLVEALDRVSTGRPSMWWSR